MAGISATGLGSNLDVSGLVEKLMTVERQPLAKLDQKEAAAQVKISAYGTFKGAVSTLKASLAGLMNTSSYTVSKADVSDTSVASVSVTADADLGSHTLEVTNLAVAQRLKSGTFSSLTDVVGTGTLTLQYGTFDNTANPKFKVNSARGTDNIKIDTTNNTLAGVRDAINKANAGVNASIVNDGTGYRLVVASKNTGTENSIRINVTDDDGDATNLAGLSQLAYDPAAATGTGTAKNLEEVTPPDDAKFLLDGILVKKPGNTVTDAISGTTINLLKKNAGSPITFSVSKDTTAVRTAVDDFVKAYNDLDSLVDKLTGYDPASKKAGDLNGDAGVRGAYAQIRDVLSSVVSSGGYTALAQVGITLKRDGQLSVDSAKLSAALAKDPKAVQGLFATTAVPSDALVSYVKSTAGTSAGNYALNVTQLATQGKAVGSTAAALTTIDGTNDTLSLKVNGVSASLTLTHATYTSVDTLVADLQSKINGLPALSSAGAKVTVTQSAGVLSVTSAKYGSGSTVELLGGNARSTLFGTATSTAGLDIAGSLGTGKATGNGQQLTSDNGLTVSVSGGATGARGGVMFTRGMATKLDDLLTQLSASKGTIGGRIDSLQEGVKDIEKKREFINAQLEVKQKRYLDQFNTLDGLLSNMQSTMSYLAQQLSSLNNIK